MLTEGVALPSVYGASSPKMNSADLRTKGYELTLAWKDMFTLAGKPFSYNVSVVFSDYITEITEYDNPEKTFAKSYYEDGRVNYICKADFSKNSELEKIVQLLIQQAHVKASLEDRKKNL